MGKLFLFLLVALGLGLYFERSRVVILDTVSPVLQPVFRWQTNGEMEKIARDLISHGTTSGSMPSDQTSFQTWLSNQYQNVEGGQDAWGNFYRLRMARDSFAIIAPGKDGEVGTSDDLQHKTARPWQSR